MRSYFYRRVGTDSIVLLELVVADGSERWRVGQGAPAGDAPPGVRHWFQTLLYPPSCRVTLAASLSPTGPTHVCDRNPTRRRRNPNSGDGTRSRRARELALDRGYEVLDTEGGDHTVELASEAARRTGTVVACGGDGTLNKTVRGVLEAGRLDETTIGVVPAGTGNDFADNVGIRGVAHAFEGIESGERRRLDIGVANGRPFLNSCVGGLTAEASARTSRQAKQRLGVLAYVLQTLSASRDFEALDLQVSVGPDRAPAWSGDALMLLVGNGRRFPGERMRQANMEDGMLNVVIIEDSPALEYLSRGAADRLLRRGASHLTRVKATHLHVTHAGDPVQFSLDGEMLTGNELTADSRPQAMRFAVGPTYDPSPEEWSRTTPQ